MGCPVKGEYFDDISPVDGNTFAKVPDSTSEDTEFALDVAIKPRTLGQDIAHGAKQYLIKNRRPSRRELGDACRCRNMGERQACA